jgi:hypothetical protein
MSDDIDIVDYREGFRSAYLSAPTLGPPNAERTLTVHRVTRRDIEAPDGKVKSRTVVHFEEDLPLVVNRTIGRCLHELWGPLVAAWAGRRVTLYHDPTVKLGPKTVGGIRVRGAPDLAAPVEVVIELPKRKPLKVTLTPTGRAQPKGQAQAPTLATLGLTRAGVDALLVSLGKPAATDAGLPAILTRLAASPDHLARAREMSRAGINALDILRSQPTPTAPADDDGPPDLE